MKIHKHPPDRSLFDIRIGNPVIRHHAGCLEPDTPLPAYFVFAELVPHAPVVLPDPDKEDHNGYKQDDGEDDKHHGFGNCHEQNRENCG